MVWMAAITLSIDRSFNVFSSWGSDQLAVWADQLSLDREKFDACRSSRGKRGVLRREFAEGQALGVEGTPSFFVNGKSVEGTVESLAKAIDDATVKWKRF